MYRSCIKRFLDILLSLLAFIFLWPVLLSLSIIIKMKLGNPIIFKQPRPGMNEKIFSLYKFRSMTNEIGEDGKLLSDSERITKFGSFLRSSSLDELPELVNIIKGDMSFVGPRPLSIYYLPHFPSGFRKRHSVRPGLTGLAQVHGRNNSPWDERLNYDIEYASSLSFSMDVRILIETVIKVLKKTDISMRGTNDVLDYGVYCRLLEERKGGRQLEGMTYSEIGSYFWLEDEETEFKGSIDWLPSVEDSSFTFSGRNAIDIAITDILDNRLIDKAYLPSYCCVSMLQPFLDHRIKVEFYNVEYTDGFFEYQLPTIDLKSIVVIMGYFGIGGNTKNKAIEELHKKGAVIIEDCTHSLLQKNEVSPLCDYSVISLRKWFAIPSGGWIGKTYGTLAKKPNLNSNDAVKEKIKGMREKKDYLDGKIESKENYLLTQAKFENDLIHCDRMLQIDDFSYKKMCLLDIDQVINRRRKNAEILIAGLKQMKGNIIHYPFVDLSTDTPLFVPIFIEEKKRDSLREYLRLRGIYCPVHWPESMGTQCSMRANELSLVCDQRYSESDMKVIISIITEWLENQLSIS